LIENGAGASALEVAVNRIRVELILLALATGILPVFITYVIGWMILPKKPSA